MLMEKPSFCINIKQAIGFLVIKPSMGQELFKGYCNWLSYSIKNDMPNKCLYDELVCSRQ